MELFVAIALLCQATSTTINYTRTYNNNLQCQQSYIHCVNMKSSITKQNALERCILERK